MALNPSYSSQSTRTLPFCVGYVYVQGTLVNSIVSGVDGSTVELYVVAEGEWDALLYISVQPGDHFAGFLLDGTYGTASKISGSLIPANAPRGTYYHFHAGSYATKGLPASLISIGPNQGTENWLQYFPSIVPALNYSGMVYYVVRRNLSGNVLGSNTSPINPIGIYRSLKCRQFDESGDVTGYSFTTNPTWHLVEAALRYHIKPQQPSLAGLTNAEKNCFDWPAIYAHSVRNSAILANGRPAFSSNYAFAADSTLANIQETILRGCRSYKLERNGKIAFIGDDARPSVFTVSQKHMVPGTLKLGKKDISTAPNVYVPQYRDLEIPAITQVVSATPSSGLTAFTTVGPQPFDSGDVFTYSGSSNDSQMAGNYQVALYTVTVSGVVETVPPPVSNQFNAIGGNPAATGATGGWLGTQQSRFAQRAPTVVQHRAHQKAIGQAAPGIAPLSRAMSVFYDMGNNTFDQTNRIMQYMMARDLGTDGPGWKAPFQGTFSVFLESVDANGNAVPEIENGDRITLDDTVAPEFAGDYEVLESTPRPASGDGQPSKVDFVVQAYNPDAFVDASYPPGDSYQTLTGSLLDEVYQEPLSLAPPSWVLQATPYGGLDGSGNLRISLPDLSIQWMGDALPIHYTDVSVSDVPLNTYLLLYLTTGNDKSVAPTLTFDASGNLYPPFPLPPGVTVIFAGTIAAGSVSAAPGSGVHPLTPSNPSGTSPVTLTPVLGNLGSAPVSGDYTV